MKPASFSYRFTRARRAVLLGIFATLGAHAFAGAPDLSHLAGSFEILDASGEHVGASTGEIVHPGAAIFESRRFDSRANEQKLWFFNSEFQNGWKQLFVGRNGTVREFLTEEVLPDGGLILGGRFSTADGLSTRFRMLITAPDAEGGHRRHLESTTDDGAGWSTVFDLMYRRQT
jgi:hypothetical protein